MSRIMGVDPGAKRMGYAILEIVDEELEIYCYGSLGVEREKNEPYQHYRLRIIDYWRVEAADIFKVFKPDEMVNEILPPVSSTIVAMTQIRLAEAALTTLQVMALISEVSIKQVGANSVKKAIGGDKDASKVKVRNGIHTLFPQTKIYANEWKHAPDTTDAFAVALYSLGVKVGR